MFVVSEWPPWVTALVWTAATMGAAYAAGHVFNAIAAARLVRAVARTHEPWAEILVAELTRRLPFWSLLIGGELSLAYWPASADAHLLVTRVLSALGVASVTLALAAVSTRLIVIYGPRASPNVPVSGLTHTLARILITIIGALVIVKSFDYDITPMLTALGVGGLAVALALQEPLSNLFAGVFTALSGQIRIGDYIRLDSGVEGHVIDFHWRSTRLRQLAGNLVVVPNAKLAQAIVTNFSLPASDMGIGLEFTVDSDSNLADVERVALEVAAEVQQQAAGALVSAEPIVRYQAFTDTGVRCAIGLRVRDFVDQPAVKHEFVKRLQARFAQEGIGLAIVPLRAPAAPTPVRRYTAD